MVNKKKKQGGRSLKKNHGNKEKLTSSSSPHRVLIAVFICWLILLLFGFIIFWKKKDDWKEQKFLLAEQQDKVPTFMDQFKSTLTSNREGKEEFTIDDQQLWDLPDQRIANLFSEICQENFCHSSLRVVGKNIRTVSPIEENEIMLEIPRSLQIWDLDAYRDPFVRRLFKACHKINGNRIGSEAFLAVFLALELTRAEVNPSNFGNLRLLYLKSLPTLEEFGKYHPILADKNLISEILGQSTARSVLNGYRFMISSEYEGLLSVSSEFASTISQNEYVRARLIVLTRRLNVGKPGPEEVMPAAFVGDEFRNEDLFLDELYSYYDLINVNLTDAGCIALVPMADLFNHHPNNNINLQYQRMQNKTGRSFIVASINRVIEAYSEPMASYGAMADSHLFARYGFVNGDGSGEIQISLAFFHEMMKLNISNQYNYLPDTGTTPKFRNYQKRGLVKYLMYDDGYAECISGPTAYPEQSELKRLKLDHLISIANEYDKWNIVVKPRQPNSLPAKTTRDPITLLVPQYENDSTMLTGLNLLQETCRLISLTNDDFDGNAIRVLAKNIGNKNFAIGSNVSDALEFRSFMCMARLFGTKVLTMELQGKLESEYRHLLQMNRNEFGSTNWTAHHVRFSEMQASQAASGLIFKFLTKKWGSKKLNPEPEYTMRDEACPDQFMNYLFHDDEMVSDILDIR